MQDKVKLPREVAEAMIRFKEQYGSESLFRIEEYVGEDTAQVDAYNVVYWMRKGNHRFYYTALVNGYEVEEEPIDITIAPEQKERAVEVYRSYANSESQGDPYKCGYYVGARNGIIQVLDELGIKIEGVNA